MDVNTIQLNGNQDIYQDTQVLEEWIKKINGLIDRV
jgi:hypothetical protein